MNTSFTLTVVRNICLVVGIVTVGIAGSSRCSAQFSLNKGVSQLPPAGQVAQMNDEMPSLVGAWNGELQIEAGKLRAQLFLEPSTQFRGAITITDPQNKVIAQVETTGTWLVDGEFLTLKDAGDHSEEKYSFRLENGLLVLKEASPDGMEIRMNPARPQNPQPNPRVGGEPQPAGISKNRPVGLQVPAPLVGQWYATGESPQGRIFVEARISNEGMYAVNLTIQTFQGTQQINDQGRLAINGNTIQFISPTGTEIVPFAIEGESLMLDYSQTNGFIMTLTRRPGGGSIQPAGLGPGQNRNNTPSPNAAYGYAGSDPDQIGGMKNPLADNFYNDMSDR